MLLQVHGFMGFAHFAPSARGNNKIAVARDL